MLAVVSGEITLLSIVKKKKKEAKGRQERGRKMGKPRFPDDWQVRPQGRR